MNAPAARRYLPGTMVLETSWATPTGWLVVRDALLMGRWHHEDELSQTHRRTPSMCYCGPSGVCQVSQAPMSIWDIAVSTPGATR